MNVSYVIPHKTQRIKIVGSDNKLIWMTHRIKDGEKLVESMKRNNLTTWESLPFNIKINCSLSGVSGFDYPNTLWDFENEREVINE